MAGREARVAFGPRPAVRGGKSVGRDLGGGPEIRLGHLTPAAFASLRLVELRPFEAQVAKNTPEVLHLVVGQRCESPLSIASGEACNTDPTAS